jgi:L-threonylcarbamoyladenylate synthase
VGKVALQIGPETIESATQILRKGGIVAFPTDTVYGLGGHAFLESAAARIFQAKRRPPHLPLPLLLADISDISLVAERVSPIAQFLAERFWPGGLTLVLPKAPRVPASVSGGTSTIAVRVPGHPVPRALARGLGAPLIGTSANLSGQPSPVTAQQVEEQLGDSVDLIIDGGPCPGGVESTVLDLTGDEPMILREGAVSRHELERAIREVSSGRKR